MANCPMPARPFTTTAWRLMVASGLMLACACCLAADVIHIPPPESTQDRRYDYSEKLLRMALDKTKAQFGATEVAYGPKMSRERVLRELERGALVQVADAPTRPDFEEKLLPVRIPLRKGLLGYRLLLIQQKDKEKFAAVRSLDDLRALRAGSGTQWAITQVFEQSGFKLTKNIDYEGLFLDLSTSQSDYLPRGVNEIFDEFDARTLRYPKLAIEESLVLYVPLPSYFFVTPTQPELARRIELGLEIMLRDGSFEKLFQDYHADMIKRARLQDRRVLELDNPLLSNKTPLDRKSLWVNFKHKP